MTTTLNTSCLENIVVLLARRGVSACMLVINDKKKRHFEKRSFSVNQTQSS